MKVGIKWFGWLFVVIWPWTALAILVDDPVIIDGVAHTLTEVTEPRIKARIQETMRWFGERTGLNVDIPLPELKYASRPYMRHVYQRIRHGDPGQAIGALYYFTRDTVTKAPRRMVLLLEKDVFNDRDLKQLSKAAHEVFHHVQFMNGLQDGIVSKLPFKRVDKFTLFQDISRAISPRKSHNNNRLAALNSSKQSVKSVNLKLGFVRRSLQDRVPCGGKLEAQAYRAQAEWLHERGYWDPFWIRHLHSIARRHDICDRK